MLLFLESENKNFKFLVLVLKHYSFCL